MEEFRNFIIAVMIYLGLGSFLAYKEVPEYVIGFLLSLWTVAVFSFEYKQIQDTNDPMGEVLKDLKRIGADCLLLILGLTPPYLALLGWPSLLQIFKYYGAFLFLSAGFYLAYLMGKYKKELLKNLADIYEKGGEDEKHAQ